VWYDGGASDMGREPMGLRNRKKFAGLCRRYGLRCREDRDHREILVFKAGEQYPDRVGIVTFSELRYPDWEKLESLVMGISLSTGAWEIC